VRDARPVAVEQEWAGESVELVRDLAPAGDVVRRIAAEADDAIARLHALGRQV